MWVADPSTIELGSHGSVIVIVNAKYKFVDWRTSGSAHHSM